MPAYWTEMLGGHFHKVHSCTFVCPEQKSSVVCRIVQDIRTGRWKGVLSCSLFGDQKPECDRECVKLLNLGVHPPEWRRSRTDLVLSGRQIGAGSG
jgi:hypothetical protein